MLDRRDDASWSRTSAVGLAWLAASSALACGTTPVAPVEGGPENRACAAIEAAQAKALEPVWAWKTAVIDAPSLPFATCVQAGAEAWGFVVRDLSYDPESEAYPKYQPVAARLAVITADAFGRLAEDGEPIAVSFGRCEVSGGIHPLSGAAAIVAVEEDCLEGKHSIRGQVLVRRADRLEPPESARTWAPLAVTDEDMDGRPELWSRAFVAEYNPADVSVRELDFRIPLSASVAGVIAFGDDARQRLRAICAATSLEAVLTSYDANPRNVGREVIDPVTCAWLRGASIDTILAPLAPRCTPHGKHVACECTEEPHAGQSAEDFRESDQMCLANCYGPALCDIGDILARELRKPPPFTLD